MYTVYVLDFKSLEHNRQLTELTNSTSMNKYEEALLKNSGPNANTEEIMTSIVLWLFQVSSPNQIHAYSTADDSHS